MSVRDPQGRIARDSAALYLDTRLTVRTGLRLLGGREQAGDSGVEWRLATCRRFGSRRVDCELRETASQPDGSDKQRCAEIRSVTLQRSGIALLRKYACDTRTIFRRHPRWLEDETAPSMIEPRDTR